MSLKIAHIGLRGIPATTGGIEAIVDNLSTETAKLGHEVTVYCRTPYCPERPKSYKGVKLIYLPTINTRVTETLVHTTLATLHAILKERPDVIHYHALANGFFSWIPKLFGIKTLITVHGLDWQREKWGPIAKMYIRFSEWVSTIGSDSILVSKKLKKYFDDAHGKPSHFIPNGVTIQKRVKLDQLKRFGIRKDEYLLFIARLVPEKGLDYLIPAFKNVQTNKKLIIAGDAEHMEQYKKKLRKEANSDPRIIFTGALTGQDKAEAFSNAYAFILPSTIEGMPVGLLEGMSYGLPCITSDIEENKDVIKDKGYTFRSKDIADITHTIQHVIDNNKEAKTRGSQAKAEVKAEYQWPKIAQQTIHIYEHLNDE